MLQGSLGIYIPEMLDKDPANRPDIEEVIQYLEFAKGASRKVPFAIWKVMEYQRVSIKLQV